MLAVFAGWEEAGILNKWKQPKYVIEFGSGLFQAASYLNPDAIHGAKLKDMKSRYDW
jgi:hypothetical protein